MQNRMKFLTMSESGNFSFSDDTTATIVGDSKENILQRVDEMRVLYSLEQLKRTSKEFSQKLFSLAPPEHLFPEQRQ